MPRRSPQDIANKWGKNLKASGDEIRKGVELVSEAPGVKAAAKQEKMQRRLNESIDDGTWGERVASVSLSDWKNKMLTKGVPRISAGVDASNGKVAEFHSQLQDHQGTIDSELERMPDVTLEDSINKMTTQVRRMSEFKFRR